MSASVFAAGPRQVRCARCAHIWMADLPPKIAAFPSETPKGPKTANLEPSLASSPPVSPQEQARDERSENSTRMKGSPVSAGSNLPAIRKEIPWDKMRLVAGVVLALGATAWLIGFLAANPLTAQAGREAARLGKAAGLIKPVVGEGLTLQRISSERRFEAGAMQLVVDGQVRNESDEVLPVPDINVKALGAEKALIQSWRIPAPAATLAAGETAPFHSSIVAPTGAVMEVNLSFIEPNHDANP